MSEQEITVEPLDPFVTEVTPAADANAARTTSEAARIARSAPDRRRALCAAQQSLGGTPGHSDAAASLLELSNYVDELEEHVFGSMDDGPEDQRETERSHELPFGGADMGALIGQSLGALAPHAATLRSISGLLSFRDQACIAIFARMNDTTLALETQASLAWSRAVALDAARPQTGGAA